MVVLYWSWERRVCSSSRPSPTATGTKWFTVSSARPEGVVKRSSSRGGLGSVNPSTSRALKSSKPGIARSIASRIRP